MNVTVNGNRRELEPAASLLDLLGALGIEPARVAVALNGAVVPRGELASVRPAEGDAVEVIEAVGGG